MASDGTRNDEPLFVGRVRTRGAGSYATTAFLWALLLVPVWFAPIVLLFLPFSVPIGLMAGWGTYCILVDRSWQLRVERERITWDRNYTVGSPHVVLTQDILRLTVAAPDQDSDARGNRITLYLRDGSERSIPPVFTSPDEQAALLQAIQRAVPQAFTRHLS